MVVKYKIECLWDQHTGWNFTFGIKRLWESRGSYIVADCHHGTIENYETFTDLAEALDYMRTNKR